MRLIIVLAPSDLCSQYNLGDQYDIIVLEPSDFCPQYKLSDQYD